MDNIISNWLLTLDRTEDYIMFVLFQLPGRVAQSVGHLTRKSGVLGSIPGLATYFRFSFRFFKKGSCQLLAKVCARSLKGLSLPRKSVVRLTDRPNMTLDVYRGRKTTVQQQQQSYFSLTHFVFLSCYKGEQLCDPLVASLTT